MMQMRIVGIQDTIQTNVIVSYAHTSTNVEVTKEKKMKIVNYEKMKRHFEHVIDVKLFTVANILTIMETFTEDLPDAVSRDDIRSGKFLTLAEKQAQESRASELTSILYMRGWNDALEAAADNGPSVFRFSEVQNETDN